MPKEISEEEKERRQRRGQMDFIIPSSESEAEFRPKSPAYLAYLEGPEAYAKYMAEAEKRADELELED